MNCCDEYGDCRQGRDCPVRTKPAKVAKVKQRAPKHPAPLRQGDHWRANLRHLAKWLLIVLAAGVAQWHDLDIVTGLLIATAAFYVYSKGL